jgi:hypothetical protein
MEGWAYISMLAAGGNKEPKRSSKSGDWLILMRAKYWEGICVWGKCKETITWDLLDEGNSLRKSSFYYKPDMQWDTGGLSFSHRLSFRAGILDMIFALAATIIVYIQVQEINCYAALTVVRILLLHKWSEATLLCSKFKSFLEMINNEGVK